MVNEYEDDNEIILEDEEQGQDSVFQNSDLLGYEEDDETSYQEHEIEYSHIFLDNNVIVYCKSDGSWFTETYSDVDTAKKIYELKTC
jgi:hypothetical protein